MFYFVRLTLVLILIGVTSPLVHSMEEQSVDPASLRLDLKEKKITLVKGILLSNGASIRLVKGGMEDARASRQWWKPDCIIVRNQNFNFSMLYSLYSSRTIESTKKPEIEKIDSDSIKKLNSFYTELLKEADLKRFNSVIIEPVSVNFSEKLTQLVEIANNLVNLSVDFFYKNPLSEIQSISFYCSEQEYGEFVYALEAKKNELEKTEK